MSQAVVADLPVPVAPSRTTSFSPAWIRAVSSLIAFGWSPDGVYSEIPSKGATVRCRSVTGRMPQPYVAPPTPASAMLSGEGAGGHPQVRRGRERGAQQGVQ